MTKEQFEKQYCERSKITLKDYHENFVTLYCKCDSESCDGWAVVGNSEIAIKAHKDLYT